MLDVALIDDAKGFDINIKDGDIESVENFKTAIQVSLFSDARADSSQVFLPEARKGWIGDIVTPIDGQNFGSLLWLVQQERLTQSTLNKVVNFARLALQWLIDQGQASRIEVSGEIVPRSGISLNIVITSILGKTESHYVELWENTIAD
ncbi:MAG: phage GP46 family protein [Candidatus Anammoxibacter sp.]